MSVRILIPPFLRPFTNGTDVVDIEGETVMDCLNELVKRFPGVEKMLFVETGKLFHYINIYINSRIADPEELSKPVSKGDEVYVVFKAMDVHIF